MKFNSIAFSALFAASLTGAPLLAGAQQSEVQTRTYSYDVNHDGFIQPEELTTYLYTRYDTNGDGYLGDEEWKVTTTNLYRPYKDVDFNTYTFWDEDKDNRINNAELAALLKKTDLYARWDLNRDKMLDNEEFERATFAAYDVDDSGTLDIEEWKSALR